MENAEKIERYYNEEHHFSKGIQVVRELVLKTELEETFKWMFPTYTLKDKNVISICKFKHHFGIWFFNGVFLKDEKKVLENAQKGKTQAMRHWKFYSIADIDKNGVHNYILEAIENQKIGKTFVPLKKKIKKVALPTFLKDELEQDTSMKISFSKLSISKQNEYASYIETAKKEKTKLSRLEKIRPLIAEEKGLNDRYK